MKNPINFFDAEFVDNELWFSNKNFNALMKMNSETGETEMVSTFEGFPPEEENLHIKTILSGDLLIFIPYLKNTIHIWNIQKNCFEKSVDIDNKQSSVFINAFKDDNDIIWILPSKLSDPIVLFDINKRTTSAFFGIKEESDSENISDVILWLISLKYQKNHIYINSTKNNICFYVDCNTKKTGKIILPDKFPVMSVFPCDDKIYFSLSRMSDIFEWNAEKKSYIRYEIDNKLKQGECYYADIIKRENKLVIIPCHSDDIIIYDIEKREYEKLIFPENFERTNPNVMFAFYREKGNEIFVFPLGCNHLIKINTDDFTLSTVLFALSDSFEKHSEDIINKVFEKNYHSGLDEFFAYKETLDMFINKLVSDDNTDIKTEEKNAGEQIHKYIVSLFG